MTHKNGIFQVCQKTVLGYLEWAQLWPIKDHLRVSFKRPFLVKCRCIEDPDEDDPIQQYHHERQYTVTTFFIILPNLAWLIFGSVVAIKSLDPPPTHELTGPGLYPPNYCYWGLWRLFHLCLIISAIFIILSFILVAIMWHKVRQFRSTNHRRESSWANYRPGGRKERNQSLKSFTAPAGNVNYSDPFDTNRY